MFSCKNPPTIKKPVKSYVISQKFNEAAVGLRELNYKKPKNQVGEWLKDPEFIPLTEAPNDLFCFSLKDWLQTIKPKLKAGSIYYQQGKNKDQNQ